MSNKSTKSDVAKKKRLSQTDVPAYSLIDALKIPRAIAEQYASQPTAPLRVAQALELSPNASGFVMLCGAALAYGLTTASAQAAIIGLTPLGLRVAKPTIEGDDLAAMQEALLKPRVVGEFLRKYNGAPIPKKDIAKNVLEDLGVPSDRTDEVLGLIVEGAESVGYIQTIKEKKYIHLSAQKELKTLTEDSGHSVETETISEQEAEDLAKRDAAALKKTGAEFANIPNRRVYISHGQNREFVDVLKKLLKFGEMEAVVSIEKQSVSQPVPDKVMREMRSCSAGIIHIDAELKLLDKDAKEHSILNSNVLIEIGAAMALYGRRFILLVNSGVALPSNLQGLYEVRYSGDRLDSDATIKLLEAINDIKNHPLPTGDGS